MVSMEVQIMTGMLRVKNILALVLLLLLGGRVSVAQPAQQPHLTRPQVINLAGKYGQIIGLDKLNEPTLAFPAYYSASRNTMKLWKVIFDGHELYIADSTGDLIGFINRKIKLQRAESVKDPDGKDVSRLKLPPSKRLTEAEVRTKSHELLKRLGMLDQLEFESADSPEDVFNGHTWFVDFQRVFKGIPYDEQFITIEYDNESKELYRFFQGFTTRKYKEVTPKLTAENAIKIAKEKMAANKFEYDEIGPQVGKIIVDVGPQIAAQPDEQGLHDCRMCWVVWFKLHRYGRIYSRFVRVDVETGAVLNIIKSSHSDPNAPPLTLPGTP